MNLLYSALITLFLSIAFYFLEKKTGFAKLEYKWRQLIIGIMFGASACFATEFGTPVDGAVMNIRDAAPICAGLLFGGPAGIIAGLIGGVHRWFAVYWGAGAYSQIACSVSTAFAGFFAALLRKNLFDDKRPSWFYGLAIGMTAEVFHMLMLFLTNMSDARTAFIITQKCASIMISVNSLTVMLAALILALIGKEKLHFPKETKQISQTFQKWLLIFVLVAFVVTSLFTGTMQTNAAKTDAESMLSLYIRDVKADIYKASDEYLLDITNSIRLQLENSGRTELDRSYLTELSLQHKVSEINIVDENGIITASTERKYLGFDMSSGEQSAEFLCLLDGEMEYVQEYRTTAYNSSVMMKYAGAAFSDGGFLQVGYNAELFSLDLDKRVVGITENRHVGESGYLVILDSAYNVVSTVASADGDVSAAQGKLDLSGVEPDKLIETSADGSDYYIMYEPCEGYYVLAVLPVSEAMLFRDMSVYITVFMEILVFACLFINIYWMVKRQVVDNIHKVNNALAEITGGNLNATVDVRSHSEFASLSDDINQTVSTLKHYIAEAAARIDKELEFAKSVQHSALPSVFPPYPNRTDFDIYSAMYTAKEVGGDFYDFYFVGEDKLAFLVADVSGKGIPAAMFMMTAKTTIKGLAEGGREVNDILTVANQKLCEANESGMFVTVWIGILDLRTGLVKFANAGHNPPLICHKGGSFEYFRSRPGLVLAGMDGVRYRMGEFTLQPGDRIFLYTDGVTEATDAKGELFGEERLESAMNRLSDCGVEELCSGVKSALDAFVGEAPQFDDITMVSLYYKGDTKMKELTVDAVIDNIDTVTDFINGELEGVDCPMKAQMQIDVAIDELFSNIARYAYHPEIGKATVRFEVQDDPMAVLITFVDNGVPYDPLKTAEPDLALSAEERAIGGLGVFMVKKTMDDISYEYINGQNILRIKKHI